MHYYQFHIGDFRSATLHLSNAEELTYRRLLDWYYDTETPIPLDTQWVSRRLRVGIEDLESVLKDFFSETPDGWVNARCEAEIAGYQGLVEKNRENGKKGGRPRKNKNPVGSQSVASGNPNESQKKPNHEPLTINQEPEDKKHRPAKAELDAAFEVFWNAYPKKVSKKDASKAWGKIKPDKHQAIMQGLFNHMSCEQWVKENGQYIPNAATWLNKERWEDEIRPYGQRTETSRDNSAVGRVKARAAERERLRQGAQPEYFGGGDFIEGDFTAGRQGDGAPLDPYDGDLWPQVGEPVR